MPDGLRILRAAPNSCCQPVAPAQTPAGTETLRQARILCACRQAAAGPPNQFLRSGLEIIGRREIPLQEFCGVGVVQPEPRRMKALTLQARQRTPTVQRIGHERVATMSSVNTDLVGPSTVQHTVQ